MQGVPVRAELGVINAWRSAPVPVIDGNIDLAIKMYREQFPSADLAIEYVFTVPFEHWYGQRVR